MGDVSGLLDFAALVRGAVFFSFRMSLLLLIGVTCRLAARGGAGEVANYTRYRGFWQE